MDELAIARKICGKDVHPRKGPFNTVYEVTGEGPAEFYVRKLLEKAAEVFDERIFPCMPKALAAGAGGAVLAFAPPAVAEEADVPAARERPAYSICIEHEDAGQREEVDPFSGYKSWMPRQWGTSLAAYRGGSRVFLAQHSECGRDVANAFGGRLHVHDLVDMGECEAYASAEGFAGRQSIPGAESKYHRMSGEAGGRIVIPQIRSVLESVSLYVSGEEFRVKQATPMGKDFLLESDFAKAFWGVGLSTGTGVFLAFNYDSMRQGLEGEEWMFRDEGRTWQLMATQDIPLGLPVLGNIFLALDMDYLVPKCGSDVRRASWCAGTYGGKGDLTLDFQHTGSTDFGRRCDFDFMLLLNGDMKREDHARRIGFREGGRNDLCGMSANPMDFYRPDMRAIKELPDHTRTAGISVESEWVNMPSRRSYNFGSFNGIVYPVGIATTLMGEDEVPVLGWVWAGGGYDTRDRRWSGSLGINMRPYRGIPVIFRLELEKREGSHPTVYASGGCQF